MSVANPTEPAGTETVAGAQSRRRFRQLAKVVLLPMIVLLVVVIGGIFLTGQRFTGQVHRYAGAFGGLDDRERPPLTAATTFLVVVNDSLSPGQPGGMGGAYVAGQARMITVLRINPDFTAGALVSLPGESWVDVPDRGPKVISESYVEGGAPLLVRTVEALTHIRIDHLAVFDLAGLRPLTDSIGGVDLMIAPGQGGEPLQPGQNHLDGAQVLDYVRGQGDPLGGAEDRVRRWHAASRALLAKVGAGGLLSSPVRGYEFLDTLSRWIHVDDTLSDGDLAILVWRMRALDARSITFVSAPVAGAAWEGAWPVVRLDPARGTELWQAVGDSDPGRYLRKYPEGS